MTKRLLHSKATVLAAFAMLVAGIGAGSATAGRYAPTGCPVSPATSQPFLKWHDSHDYFLAPGGDMESDLSGFGWTLYGNAGLVSGNEPWNVTGDTSDSMSLGLPAGSSAMTPAICVTIHDPELRFFALSSGGGPKAALDVSAFFIGNDGKPHVKDLGVVSSDPGPGPGPGQHGPGHGPGGHGWMVTDPISIKPAIQPGEDGTAQLSFIFTPKDKGDWQIDDLYIDPLKSQ